MWDKLGSVIWKVCEIDWTSQLLQQKASQGTKLWILIDLNIRKYAIHISHNLCKFQTPKLNRINPTYVFKPLREGPKRHTWNVIFSKNFIIFTVLSHFTTYVPRLKSSLHHTVVVFVKNCPKTLRHFCLLNPWTMNQFNQNIKYLVRHLSQYYVMTLIQYFWITQFQSFNRETLQGSKFW